MSQLRDFHGEFLRSQTMAHLMPSMGLTELHDYGSYNYADGVGITLDNDRQINRRTRHTDPDGTTWVYDVTVSVEVRRRKVERDGR